MQDKHQIIALGSPKNVTLNILNGNSFFSFDYQNNDKTDQMHQTLQSFLGQNIPITQDHKNIFRTTTISVKNPNYVKSAQYSRKLLQSNIMNRSTFNPYTRIKRVEGIIQEKKLRQSSLENRTNLASYQSYQDEGVPTGFLPQVVECRTERVKRSDRSEEKEKEVIMKSLTIDPEALVDQSNNHHSHNEKWMKKNTNAFSQNYKNRKKLLDRVSHRRAYAGKVSPLRWDSKPQDIIQNEQQSKHWSPYSGKLINYAKDPLLKSIQGNRIRYVHHETKYYKGKLQQATKI